MGGYQNSSNILTWLIQAYLPALKDKKPHFKFKNIFNTLVTVHVIYF